jgi:hypothetical protein
VFFWSNTKFIVEGVMPDLLHVVPVGHDAVFDRVFQGENTTFGLGFIADVRVFLSHTDHHTLMAGATNDRLKDSTGCIITGKASFAHT